MRPFCFRAACLCFFLVHPERSGKSVLNISEAKAIGVAKSHEERSAFSS